MKLLKWLGLTLLGLMLLLTLGSLLLPRTFTVERSVVVQAQAARVYALVAAPRAWKDWSAWNRRDPAMQLRYSGPEQGEGAAWAWESASEGRGEMTMVDARPPGAIGYRLHFPNFGSDSSGGFTFTPEGDATRVVWRMDGDVGTNPLYRWMPLLMNEAMERDFDTGLAGLKALAER